MKERVALVTGAGSGLGRAAALRLAAEGARIGALDLSEEELGTTVEDIRAQGGEAIGLTADISNEEEMRAEIGKLVERWGRLDVLFANAGINGLWAPIEELDLEEWRRTVEINLTGTFITIKSAVPHLKKQGGSIIITSSVNGTRIFSNTGATAYSSTKAGQLAMGQMLALELAKHRIRVNVICPGWISTNIDESTEKRGVDEAKEPVQYPEGSVPLTDGQPGSPEQVADLVLFLASDASSHISGSPIWIDGAQSLLEG